MDPTQREDTPNIKHFNFNWRYWPEARIEQSIAEVCVFAETLLANKKARHENGAAREGSTSSNATPAWVCNYSVKHEVEGHIVTIIVESTVPITKSELLWLWKKVRQVKKAYMREVWSWPVPLSHCRR
ncbi:hypothetical protein Q8F55_006197 [Vanrija albida]|uniref:Uncharacterized protein n=1 Tax=Vanrija albida TaxID=181172 RepID=A0ABR3PWG2_9TREE